MCVCLEHFPSQSPTFVSQLPSLSSNFYHQGKTTTNSITYFCVMITKVLVQTYNTRGNINGATLPVSKLEQGGAWPHWSSSSFNSQSRRGGGSGWIFFTFVNFLYFRTTLFEDETTRTIIEGIPCQYARYFLGKLVIQYTKLNPASFLGIVRPFIIISMEEALLWYFEHSRTF